MANDPLATVKNRRAAQQLSAQEAKVKALGGTVHHGGPSILSRVFDVISRPMYAIQEPVARISEHRSPGDVLKGVVGGLAGKNKTDFGDTLLRSAVANPDDPLSKAVKENKGNLRTIAGLAGDIAFDPVTYTGVGLEKAGLKGVAQVAGMKAAQEAAGTAENVTKVLEAGEKAKQARLARGAVEVLDKKSGVKTLQTAEEVASKAEKAGQKAARTTRLAINADAANTVGKAAEEAALTPGKVQLKFAGRKIAESEKLYKGTAKLGEIVGDTAVGQKLNEAFRTAAKFPEITNRLRRQTQLAGIAHAEEDIKGMRKFFSPLTKDEKIMISHAIEGNVDLTGVASKADPAIHLQHYADEAKRILRSMGEDEAAAGVFRDVKQGGKVVKKADEHLIDNYVYHWYEGGTKAERDAFKNSRRLAVGTETPGFTQQRTIKTLKEAKEAGLRPIESIDDIIAKRTGKHYGALARRKYVDAVVKEYGVNETDKVARKLMKDHGWVMSKSSYAPKGTMLPAHIEKSLGALEEMGTNNELYNSFLRVFDKAQNQWKYGATQINPGHHLRNMVGDAWNSFLDGTRNPKHYEDAGKVLWGDSDMTLRVGNVPLKRSDILRLNIESGARPGFTMAEINQADMGALKGAKRAITNLAEQREEYMRMAHFLSALKDEGKGAKTIADVEKAAENAAARVRKYNIDYGDVTDFERRVMKRAVPFYTWSRKNIPLQLEALALHPGRIAGIPKANAAISRLFGNEPNYNSYGDLDTIPKWLKEMAPIRIRGEGQGGNAIYWAPALPFQDVSKFLEGGEQGILGSLTSQLTPAVRIPFERATGRLSFSGAPAGGMGEYTISQVPMARTIFQTLRGKENAKSVKNLNYLTGLGLYEVKPNQVAGELNRRRDPLQKAISQLRKNRR